MRAKHLQYAKKPNRKERRHAAQKGTSCPCGTDNDHQLGGNYQATFDALNKILAVSEAARKEDTFKPALAAFVASLREVAPVFKATGYKDLKEKLEAMSRQEAEWQRQGYERKDSKAGDVHGGRRGLVQEAQLRMAIAQEHIATLKAHEATKKAAKAKDKPAKGGKAREMSEAAAVEAGAKRGAAIVDSTSAEAVKKLAKVDGYEWASETRRHHGHRIDKVPEKHSLAYYAALEDAARKRAREIATPISKK